MQRLASRAGRRICVALSCFAYPPAAAEAASGAPTAVSVSPTRCAQDINARVGRMCLRQAVLSRGNKTGSVIFVWRMGNDCGRRWKKWKYSRFCRPLKRARHCPEHYPRLTPGDRFCRALARWFLAPKKRIAPAEGSRGHKTINSKALQRHDSNRAPFSRARRP